MISTVPGTPEGVVQNVASRQSEVVRRLVQQEHVDRFRHQVGRCQSSELTSGQSSTRPLGGYESRGAAGGPGDRVVRLDGPHEGAVAVRAGSCAR